MMCSKDRCRWLRLGSDTKWATIELQKDSGAHVIAVAESERPIKVPDKRHSHLSNGGERDRTPPNFDPS